MPDVLTGSVAYPVKQDPSQWIVGYSRPDKPIGILQIDTVQMADYEFDEPYSYQFIVDKSPGDPIPAEDYAVASDPIVVVAIDGENDVATVYDVTHHYWAVEAFMAAPGTAPPTGEGYEAATANYNSYVAAYTAFSAVYVGPTYRLQEVLDLRTLLDPPAEEAVFAGPLPASGPWATYDYGTQTIRWYPNFPDSLDGFIDEVLPGYNTYQVWDPAVVPQSVAWGLGEVRDNQQVVVKQVRRSYLVLFKFLPVGEQITISQAPISFDIDEFPGFDTVFTLRVYSGGTFEVSAGGLIENVGGTLLPVAAEKLSEKSMSYRLEGAALVGVGRDGLV